MEAAVMQEEERHELVPQLRFPPGYHFVPSEQELLSYLRGKIEGQEQSLVVVNKVVILDWQPGSLVEAYKGYGENKWYFFTVREQSTSNKEEEPNRKVRVPGVKATWKATGRLALITATKAEQQQDDGGMPAEGEEEKVILGTKRVLIYQSSDAEEDGKWSMHEYVLRDHAKIGQYALCSIQRKQHSDTVDNADEGTGSPHRTATGGLQLQQVQETASNEAPKSRKRRTATKKKNKASGQDDEGQQHQEVAPVSSVKPPLTPPQQAPPQALQQSAPLLPAAPLQGYTSPTDGMLGASAPMHEEGRRANSFQYDDDMPRSDLDSDLENLMILLEEQKEQPQSFANNEFITGSHAQHQQCYQQDDHIMFGDLDQYLLPELQHFPGNITQNNSSWNQGQLQNYQQEVIGGALAAPALQLTEAQHYQLQNYQQEIIGSAFPAPALQHADAQHYQHQNYQQGIIGGAFAAGQSPYGQMCYSYPLPQTRHYSSDHFTGSVQGDSVACGSYGGMGVDAADELFAIEALRDDDDPQGCVGTQGSTGNNPEAFQSQDELLRSSGQQQHAPSDGHGCDAGPPPSRSVSEFWER